MRRWRWGLGPPPGCPGLAKGQLGLAVERALWEMRSVIVLAHFSHAGCSILGFFFCLRQAPLLTNPPKLVQHVSSRAHFSQEKNSRDRQKSSLVSGMRPPSLLIGYPLHDRRKLRVQTSHRLYEYKKTVFAIFVAQGHEEGEEVS